MRRISSILHLKKPWSPNPQSLPIGYDSLKQEGLCRISSRRRDCGPGVAPMASNFALLQQLAWAPAGFHRNWTGGDGGKVGGGLSPLYYFRKTCN